MWRRLSQRDKRAAQFGAVAVVAIVAYFFAAPWFSDWQTTRTQLQRCREQLEAIGAGRSARAAMTQQGLATVVPKFEMPQAEAKQTVLFRNEFNRQLKQAGINAKSLQYMAAKKLSTGGYKTLRLQCKARCNLQQVLDLLAGLNENAYLVGIEELQIKPDARERQNVDLVLTVSTFVL